MDQSRPPTRPIHLAAPCLHPRYGRVNRALLDRLERPDMMNTVTPDRYSPERSKTAITTMLGTVCGTAHATTKINAESFDRRLDKAAQCSTADELNDWADWISETRETLATVEAKIRNLAAQNQAVGS